MLQEMYIHCRGCKTKTGPCDNRIRAFFSSKNRIQPEYPAPQPGSYYLSNPIGDRRQRHLYLEIHTHTYFFAKRPSAGRNVNCHWHS